MHFTNMGVALSQKNVSKSFFITASVAKIHLFVAINFIELANKNFLKTLIIQTENHNYDPMVN